MQVTRYLLLICFFIFLGCKKESMVPLEYVTYVKSEVSGMYKEKVVGEYVFQLQKEPIPFKVLNLLRKEQVTKEEFAEYAEGMEGMQYYIMKIGVEGSQESILKFNLESEIDYQNRLSYFSFGFQQHIYLEEGNKIVPCTLFHFERMYDLTPFRTFVLGFEQTGEREFEDKTVVIDSDFFQTGKVKIKIAGSDIKSLPEVILI